MTPIETATNKLAGDTVPEILAEKGLGIVGLLSMAAIIGISAGRMAAGMAFSLELVTMSLAMCLGFMLAGQAFTALSRHARGVPGRLDLKAVVLMAVSAVLLAIPCLIDFEGTATDFAAIQL